ncbi:MAG: DUF2069 domain-containing protein [Pseudomonadota bacterium]
MRLIFKDPRLYYGLSLISMIALIILGGAWERFLAPLRPGGTILSLKILPLFFLLWGILKGRAKAFQWGVLVVWLYVAEGSVRLYVDRGISQQLAILELFLALIFFASCTMWLRLVRLQK